MSLLTWGTGDGYLILIFLVNFVSGINSTIIYTPGGSGGKSPQTHMRIIFKHFKQNPHVRLR